MPRRAILLCLLFAGPLFAQEPADRARVDAFRDTLGALTDPAAVVRIAEREKASRPAGDKEIGRLRLGWTLVRLGQLTESAPPLIEAANEFYEVTVKHREWPYAWLGLGLTKLELDAGGSREVVSPHQFAGSGWLSGAIAAFEQALRRRPDFGRAIAGVAEVHLREPSGPNAGRASRLLRSYAQRYQLDAPGALALARIETADAHWDHARELIERYRSERGDPRIAAWELGRIAFGQARPEEGAKWYFEAAMGGPAAARLVRENLALIATPNDLRAFDASPPAERGPQLERFWSDREVSEGRPPTSRLREHFRRIRYARAHFATGATLPQFSFEQVYRDAPRGLDDRGAIYIRHGEPDARATYVGGMSTPPNESWSYFRPQGPLILHFAALGPGGYRLLESLSAIGGDLAALYESRAGLGTEFLHLSSRFELEAARRKLRIEDPRLISPESRERERQHTRAMIRLGTTTDSDPLDLDRAWQPIVQVFGTTDPGSDSTGLLVVVAIPAPQGADVIALPGGAAGYVIRIRATAANDSGVVTLDSDSVRRLSTPRPLRSGEYLTLVQHFMVREGEQRVRIIVADSTESRGAVRIFPEVPIVGVRVDSLTVSDLITGREGSGVEWQRPDGRKVILQPLNAWLPSETLTLAFD
ncbi:MAG: GWxTD domain-containing protein, partial [Gemmatimonadales bacterium]